MHIGKKIGGMPLARNTVWLVLAINRLWPRKNTRPITGITPTVSSNVFIKDHAIALEHMHQKYPVDGKHRPYGFSTNSHISLTLASIISTLCLLSFILAACTSSTSSNTPIPAQPGIIQATFSPDTFHEYPLPQKGSGMMRPAIDHHGRIWFGEMTKNYLAVFDPQTHTFQQMTPPHGHYGIMSVAVAPDDSIWFVEQYADYIGHYYPNTGQYHIYSLPALTIPDPVHTGQTLSLPSAPNDLALDRQGNIWFTEINADSLGKLDPATGAITQYPLSPQKSVQKLDPYGITIDPTGTIWFTEATSARIGRFDPAPKTFRYYTPSQSGITSLMEIISDAEGNIWCSAFNTEAVLRLNPHTESIATYQLAQTGNASGAIYGIVSSAPDQVWVTLSADNVVVHLDETHHTRTYYQLPASSAPLGIVIGSHHTLWFAEGGSDSIASLSLSS